MRELEIMDSIIQEIKDGKENYDEEEQKETVGDTVSKKEVIKE